MITDIETDREDAAASKRSPDDLLTTTQLARVLQLSPRTIEEWRLSGRGPRYARAGGRRVLYRWGDVLAWLEQKTAFSTTEEQAHD